MAPTFVKRRKLICTPDSTLITKYYETSFGKLIVLKNYIMITKFSKNNSNKSVVAYKRDFFRNMTCKNSREALGVG